MRNDQAGLADPQPDAGTNGNHDVQLTASLQGQRVVISATGDPSPSLPARSGSHRFNFSLTDNTGLSVKFRSLDSEDNCSTCPPSSGQNSNQIVGVTINDTSAAFTDNNSGPATDVAYQWNFTCSDQSKLPISYDPIIRNGGNN